MNDVDEVIEPDSDAYTDPLDELPASLREPAKMYRAIAVLYLVVRNADRVGAILRATAQSIEQLIAEAESELERGDAG